MSLINAEERTTDSLLVQAPPIVIERLIAWGKNVNKLREYFTGVAKIHKETAKQFNQLAEEIFISPAPFLVQLQHIYSGIRDETRVIADQHRKLSANADSIAADLANLISEIEKCRKHDVDSTERLAKQVRAERAESVRLTAQLRSHISSFDKNLTITSKTDPYVVSREIVHQFAKQEKQEQRLLKSVFEMEQTSQDLDVKIVGTIQLAWQRYEQSQAAMSASVAVGHTKLMSMVSSLEPSSEWLAFAGPSGYIFHPNMPPPTVKFSDSHLSIKPRREGPLDRIKRKIIGKNKKQGYFVLTRANFLHQYGNPDPMSSEGRKPVFSLYLPACKLSALSNAQAKVHAFSIAGRTENPGSAKAFIPKSLHSNGHAQLSAERTILVEWWNVMAPLCEVYGVSPELIDVLEDDSPRDEEADEETPGDEPEVDLDHVNGYAEAPNVTNTNDARLGGHGQPTRRATYPESPSNPHFVTEADVKVQLHPSNANRTPPGANPMHIMEMNGQSSTSGMPSQLTDMAQGDAGGREWTSGNGNRDRSPYPGDAAGERTPIPGQLQSWPSWQSVLLVAIAAFLVAHQVGLI
ncbi:hypothetical protein C8R47DRAFT_1218614 [Mycena vitilis]|nr:hypothetical protein C8R47DRAFT_1218614 [Mycena vitilis]